MGERAILNEGFERHRARLRAVAYRMLGSRSEAEDAVQEAWLRLAAADSSAVENLGGWLTTVVARVCLDVLRSRKAHREEPLVPEAADTAADDADAEGTLAMADSVGVALLVVLEALTPVERVAFVLHDLFDVPFEEIAAIVGRSAAATRQLASRARRRMRGSAETVDADRERRREVVAAFLAASRDGDFAGLLAVLDPDVVLHADATAVAMSVANRQHGAPDIAPQVFGAEAVATAFRGRARTAQPALIDGMPGLVFAPGTEVRAVFDFVIEHGRIIEIALLADPAAIRARVIERGGV